MRRTQDYGRYELADEDDIGSMLRQCLSEMADGARDFAESLDELVEDGEVSEADREGIRKNRAELRKWNPSKEEMARWCTLLYSQWLLGKFEDDVGVDLENEKNAAVRKYLDTRTPQIFAYIEAGCPGYRKE